MLKNLSSIVTGGAEGIGKALAESIIKHGAKVTILDIDSDKGFETEKQFNKAYGDGCVMFEKCDVTNSNNLREAFLKAYDKFGGLHLLVNSAGVATFKEEQWRRTIDVNLVSVIECCNLAKELMTKSTRDGSLNHIVNIASAGGLAGMAVDPVYSASKHGVVGLCRSLSERLAPLKIRVNCLCPMFVDTALFREGSIINEEYAQLLKDMPLLNTSDVTKVFDELLKENTTGEILHISPKGSKQMNKKVARL